METSTVEMFTREGWVKYKNINAIINEEFILYGILVFFRFFEPG